MPNLLTQENFIQLQATVAATLADTPLTHLSLDELLEKAVESAIGDVSRHIPRQGVYHTKLNRLYQRDMHTDYPIFEGGGVWVTQHPSLHGLGYSYGAEHHVVDMKVQERSFWVIDEDVVMGHPWTDDFPLAFHSDFRPLKPFSEKVWQTTDFENYNYTGPYLVRGTDYLVNYATGVFLLLPGCSVLPGPTFSSYGHQDGLGHISISYEVEPTVIDLTTIEESMKFDTDFRERLSPIRVTAVEYPMGRTPQRFLTFSQWGRFLYADFPPGIQMDQDIAIHYETTHWILTRIARPRRKTPIGHVVWTLVGLEWDINPHLFEPQWYDDPPDPEYVGGIIYNFAVEPISSSVQDELVKPIMLAIRDVVRRIPIQCIRDYIIDYGEDADYLSNGGRTIDISTITQLPEESFGLCLRPWLESYPPKVDNIAGLYGSQYRGEVTTGEIIGNFIRVVAVEHPVGNTPRTLVDFHVWGDKLYLYDKPHDRSVVRVYYEAEPFVGNNPDWWTV